MPNSAPHIAITDLQSLRAEKQKVKNHIRFSDEVLKAELELLPPFLVKTAMKEVTSHFRLSKLVSLAGTLLHSPVVKSSGKGLLAGIATEAAIMGGIKLATRLLSKWRK